MSELEGCEQQPDSQSNDPQQLYVSLAQSGAPSADSEVWAPLLECIDARLDQWAERQERILTSFESALFTRLDKFGSDLNIGHHRRKSRLSGVASPRRSGVGETRPASISPTESDSASGCPPSHSADHHKQSIVAELPSEAVLPPRGLMQKSRTSTMSQHARHLVPKKSISSVSLSDMKKNLDDVVSTRKRFNSVFMMNGSLYHDQAADNSHASFYSVVSPNKKTDAAQKHPAALEMPGKDGPQRRGTRLHTAGGRVSVKRPRPSNASTIRASARSFTSSLPLALTTESITARLSAFGAGPRVSPNADVATTRATPPTSTTPAAPPVGRASVASLASVDELEESEENMEQSCEEEELGESSQKSDEGVAVMTPSFLHSPYSVVWPSSSLTDTGEETALRLSWKDRLQMRLQGIVISPFFDTVCGLAIVMNSGVIGAETEYNTVHLEQHRAFYIAQLTFNLWYLMELLLRFGAEGIQFFYSANWKWNIFDCVLICTSVVELFSELLYDGGWAVMGRLIRSLRVLRVVRTLRIVRLLRYVREFRKMIFSITGSLQTLFWSMFLLGVMMYMFAVFFTQGVVEWLRDNHLDDPETVASLEEYWGTLARSMYSLYMAIAGGISWGLLVHPLVQIHWLFTSFFLVFISISIFGVLNVLTSVFVESAMMSANHYKDLLIQERIHDKEVYARHMRDVFRRIDVDNSGTISPEELDFFLNDESLRLYLEALDLDLIETKSLFKLLDRDDSGEVNINEFCEGCLRLKGDAKSFDIHCLMYENQRMIVKWKEFMKFTEDKLVRMEVLMESEYESETSPEASKAAHVAEAEQQGHFE